MKRLLLFLLLITPLAFAGRGAIFNNTLSATGADTAVNANNHNASSYILQYTAVVTPATLSIKLQSTVLGDFSDAIDCGSPSTNTSSGTITCTGVFAKIRANITTLTGASASINYSLSTIYSDQAASGTGTSANQVQGTAASGSPPVGNPLLIAGFDGTNVGRIGIGTTCTSGCAIALGYANAGYDGVANGLVLGATAPGNNNAFVFMGSSYLFNNVSWDRPRSVINSTDSIGTGIPAVGVLAQLDDTSPSSVTENQFGNLRMDTQRILRINQEGMKATYHCAGKVTPAATPTDVIQITGSASKTIRIVNVSITVESTTAGVADVLLNRKSSADTGGTSSTPTIGKNDSNNAAATGVCTVYTANPTVNGLVATVGARGAAGTQGLPSVFDFSIKNGQALVLRGTGELLAVNGNGDTLLAGEIWDYDIEWTEE